MAIVKIPVRIRTDPNALGARPDDIDAAVAAATSRALAHARSRTGPTRLAVFHPPVFAWSGGGAGQVPAAQRQWTQSRIVAQLQQATGGQGGGTAQAVAPQAGGAPVRPRSRRRRWRGWRVLQAEYFHTTVGQYTEYAVNAVESKGRDFWSLYEGMSEERKRVALWHVRVDRTYRKVDLARELSARAVELTHLRNGEIGLWIFICVEWARQELVAIDQDGVVARVLPDFTPNARFVEAHHGEIYLRRGTQCALTMMVLPQVTIGSLAQIGSEIEVRVPYRHLEFMIDAKGFESFLGVPWTAFLSEMGATDATLRILPFQVTKPVSHFTLSTLIEEVGLSRPAEADTRVFSRFELLQREFMDSLQPSVRPWIEPLSDPATLGLQPSDRWERWRPGWRGGLFSAAVMVTPDLRFAALNRAEARKLADAIVALLASYRSDITWALDLKHLFDHFTTARGPEGVRTLFDLVLEELEGRENGRWFNSLLDRVPDGYSQIKQSFLELSTLSARYVRHPRIVRMLEAYNEESRGFLRNAYSPAEQVIWLDKNPAWRLQRGEVLADKNSTYASSRKVQNLVESRRLAFKDALEEQAKKLLDEIVRGTTTRELTPEEFSSEAINRATRAIHLTDDDFLQVTELTSFRVTGIELQKKFGIERYLVTITAVRKLEGESTWTDIEGAARSVPELDLEWAQFAWEMGRTGRVLEVVGLVVTGIGVVLIAWEAGVIALLVEAAGGTGVVLTSIVISNVLYLVFAKEYTIEGFVMATIDGYLFALTFRFGGLAGRALALRIGTQTMPRIVGGWAAQSLVTGVVGGAAGGGAVTFAHGIAGVLLHRSPFPTLGDFVKGMTMGALMGLFGEFVLGPALQAAFRVGGATVLNTIEDAVRLIRESGTSPARYAAEISQALGAIRQRLATFLEESSVIEIVAQLRQRMADLGAGLETLPGALVRGARRRMSVALYRRIFELADVGLGRIESDGLARLLTRSEAGATTLTEEQLLTFLNAVARDRQTAVDTLHALGRLTDERVSAVIAGRQLDALPGSSHLLRNLRSRDIDLAWEVWSGQSFRLRTAEFDAFLGRIARHSDDQQIFGLEVLGRPDQLVTPSGVERALEKCGLDNRIVAGLDRLYAALDAARADGSMATVASGNARRYLEFLATLNQDYVNRIADEGILRPLANAPRVVEFAGRGNLSDLQKLIGVKSPQPGNPAEVIAGLEQFFTVESSLTGVQQAEVVGHLTRLLNIARSPRQRFNELLTLAAAAARARQAALGGPLETGIQRVTALLGDNVHPNVAQEMLRPPPGVTVTNIEVAGPGGPSPDVLFETAGGTIGREAVSVTAASATPTVAETTLRDRLVRSIGNKVWEFTGRPGSRSDYIAREIDVHVRLALDGFNFDAILKEPLIKSVMLEVARRTPDVGLIARIRFYGASGNLVHTWVP